VHTGLVSFTPDIKGTIRRYERALPTDSGSMPSLACALAHAFGPRCGPVDAQARTIGFRRGLLVLTAADALRLAARPAFAASGPLRGRIVLVGGTYRAARDQYHTPLGMMPGLHILAQVVETELDGGGRRPASLVYLALLQLLLMLLAGFLYHGLEPGRAFAASLALLPVLAFVGSWLLTGTIVGGIAYFVPLLVLVIISILYEKTVAYRELLIEHFVARGSHDTQREIKLVRAWAAVGPTLKKLRLRRGGQEMPPPGRQEKQPPA
jgi:hypothetical protein